MNSSVFPWKMMAIAASAVMVLFVGGAIFSGNQQAFSQQIHRPMIAANESAIDSSGKNAVPGKAIALSAIKKAKPPIHRKKTANHKAITHVADSTIEKSSGKTPADAVYDDGPTPLNEMLVLGITAPKKTVDNIHGGDDAAHPKAGWDNFEKYLSTEAVAPDGKTGDVRLSFMVAPNGSLGDFKVRGSLDKQADQKAIELLKNGPSWTGSTNKRPSEVNLSVSFH